jgi:RES domain-containing protein
MARASRGPTGHAPAPPPWLSTASLPLVEFAAGSIWMRCHRTAQGAVFFGPGAGRPPKHRFDAPDGEYQVLYVGLSYEAALVETLLRNPRRRIVDLVDLKIRSRALLSNRSPLRLVQAHGDGLSQLGTTAALSTGGYRASRQWSLALRSHKSRPDGLIYVSRHNPSLLCAALFDRPHATFVQTATTSLLDDEPSVRTVFRAHGKSIG